MSEVRGGEVEVIAFIRVVKIFKGAGMSLLSLLVWGDMDMVDSLKSGGGWGPVKRVGTRGMRHAES